ncbi:MAG: S41 family peptidase [Planctomycetia bacterium]
MPLRNCVCLAVAVLVCLASWAARERDGRGRRFGEVLGHIDRAYLEPVDGESLFTTAVEAAVGGLDEHSAFLRDDDRDALESLLDQEFGGIGLELGIDDQTRALTVLAPLPGSPAWRAGIVAGDRIEAIDGQPTAGLPIREAVRRLRGRPGDSVRLRVVSAVARDTLDPAAASTPAAREVGLVREVVKVESVLGDRRRPDGTWEWIVADEPGVALVRIASFGDHTVADLDAALDAIKRQAGDGLRGLVVDLRGNPGGLLSAACETCDRFLDEGVIVSTAGRRSGAGAGDAATIRRAEPGVALPGVPLAVLVDGLTASAAEIVAAVGRENCRTARASTGSASRGDAAAAGPWSARSRARRQRRVRSSCSAVGAISKPGSGDTPHTVFSLSPGRR